MRFVVRVSHSTKIPDYKVDIHHEGLCQGGGISPLILNLGTWMEVSGQVDALVTLPLGRRAVVIH